MSKHSVRLDTARLTIHDTQERIEKARLRALRQLRREHDPGERLALEREIRAYDLALAEFRSLYRKLARVRG